MKYEAEPGPGSARYSTVHHAQPVYKHVSKSSTTFFLRYNALHFDRSRLYFASSTSRQSKRDMRHFGRLLGKFYTSIIGNAGIIFRKIKMQTMTNQL
jgi:hypothetical protein